MFTPIEHVDKFMVAMLHLNRDWYHCSGAYGSSSGMARMV